MENEGLPTKTDVVPEKNKGGRPKGTGKPFNWVLLDGLLKIGGRLKDCQDIMELSHDVIQRTIKREKGVGFTEYRDLKMSRMRTTLLQKQYETAMSGNVVMLIWLGKQHLGQAEKIEQQNDVKIIPKNIKLIAKE